MGRLMQQLPRSCGCATECNCGGGNMWGAPASSPFASTSATEPSESQVTCTTRPPRTMWTCRPATSATRTATLRNCWVDLGLAVTGTASLFARALAYAQMPGVDLDLSSVMGLAAQAQADADEALRDGIGRQDHRSQRRDGDPRRDVEFEATAGNLEAQLQTVMQVAVDAMHEAQWVQQRVDADIAQRDVHLDQLDIVR